MARELLMTGAALVVLAGCPKAAPNAAPPARAPATYEVEVAVASGPRAVQSSYLIEVEGEDDVRVFRTLKSAGTWDEGAEALSYDSAEPRGSDPWPLTLQQAIAGVPAKVRLDEGGAPVEVIEASAWRATAMKAIADLELPPQASRTASALLQPGGLVRDLARSFPGTPPDSGEWARAESVAGLPARRVETCRKEEAAGRTTWKCEGRIEGGEPGRARLAEVASLTVLVADRKGLVRLDSGFQGRIEVLDPEGAVALERPVAGSRSVVRR